MIDRTDDLMSVIDGGTDPFEDRVSRLFDAAREASGSSPGREREL